MGKLTLNSIPTSVFKVNANDTADGSKTRADIVGAGRLLSYEYARKGKLAVNKALNKSDDCGDAKLSSTQYKELNERFQIDHMLYAAKIASNSTGRPAPESYEDFKKSARQFYNNRQFFAVLSGIYEEIVTPILPAVFSEAVDVFANVHEVGFGETYSVSLSSDDIPVFQDSAWGAARSVPRNRFYAKDYTLSPQPKTAQINAKWSQLIGNGVDFGQFFANITAGIYAKELGMWNAAMVAAASDTALVPSGYSYSYNQSNWVALAQKLAAVNNTTISNIRAYGSALALSKVLPTNSTGSTSTAMDAAIATLLGADYVKAGYLGQYMSVSLMPIQDAVIPNTLHSTATTILDNAKIWLMSSTGRKPMEIAYDSGTPISIEIDPMESSDFEIAMNMTIALDSVATFASHVGLITVS